MRKLCCGIINEYIFEHKSVFPHQFLRVVECLKFVKIDNYLLITTLKIKNYILVRNSDNYLTGYRKQSALFRIENARRRKNSHPFDTVTLNIEYFEVFDPKIFLFITEDENPTLTAYAILCSEPLRIFM